MIDTVGENHGTALFNHLLPRLFWNPINRVEYQNAKVSMWRGQSIYHNFTILHQNAPCYAALQGGGRGAAQAAEDSCAGPTGPAGSVNSCVILRGPLVDARGLYRLKGPARGLLLDTCSSLLLLLWGIVCFESLIPAALL